MPDFKAIGLWPAKSQFNVSDIPDLTGKVAIVTGANAGIGKCVAEQLLAHGAKVYVACRSKERAEAAIEEIKTKTGKSDVHFLHLDLSDVKQCVDSAKEFLSLEERLDILINNAGIQLPPTGSLSKDGYELQFAVNTLGHWAFTKTLFDALIKTAKIDVEADGVKNESSDVRVVWVSSCTHDDWTPNRDGIDYDSLKKDINRVDGYVGYGQSKLATIHLATATSNLLSYYGIISASVHPGVIKSELQRHSLWYQAVILFIGYPPEMLALTPLYVATSPEVTLANGAGGGYYIPWAVKYKAGHPKADDKEAIEKTLEFCEDALENIVKQ